MIAEELNTIQAAIRAIQDADTCLLGVRCYQQQNISQAMQHHYAAIQLLNALVKGVGSIHYPQEKSPATTGL